MNKPNKSPAATAAKAALTIGLSTAAADKAAAQTTTPNDAPTNPAHELVVTETLKPVPRGNLDQQPVPEENMLLAEATVTTQHPLLGKTSTVRTSDLRRIIGASTPTSREGGSDDLTRKEIVDAVNGVFKHTKGKFDRHESVRRNKTYLFKLYELMAELSRRQEAFEESQAELAEQYNLQTQKMRYEAALSVVPGLKEIKGMAQRNSDTDTYLALEEIIEKLGQDTEEPGKADPFFNLSVKDLEGIKPTNGTIASKMRGLTNTYRARMKLIETGGPTLEGVTINFVESKGLVHAVTTIHKAMDVDIRNATRLGQDAVARDLTAARKVVHGTAGKLGINLDTVPLGDEEVEGKTNEPDLKDMGIDFKNPRLRASSGRMKDWETDTSNIKIRYSDRGGVLTVTAKDIDEKANWIVKQDVGIDVGKLPHPATHVRLAVSVKEPDGQKGGLSMVRIKMRSGQNELTAVNDGSGNFVVDYPINDIGLGSIQISMGLFSKNEIPGKEFSFDYSEVSLKPVRLAK